ncbi:acetate/propionate family kinase [Marinomonas fungiae]|uniref:Acetate kinase n=1 Tax=Marinomonas fungiae TaxID=1137284 RepID=A0A0K6IJZ2_9GAMM|nr:acetate kinase [Marinomonas fungiae]CUB03440.1 acetate kinase [Marinomonas fungiae]
MEQILVVNCGSSSLKFAIMDGSESPPLMEGIAERLGSEHSIITFKYDGKKHEQPLHENDHRGAVTAIKNWIDQHSDLDIKLVGIGHRVVHGGELFTKSVVINKDVLQGIEECSQFAPLHNPAHVKGIKESQALFGDLPQVAVFDTAFHQTLAADQYLYPIPMRLYREHHFRKYGFHGTSYRFIEQKLASLDETYGQQNTLVAHLGNGASVCAIRAGKSVDTSMGITPLEGLMMGTRSGSLDPSLLAFISDAEHITMKQALDILNKESGLKGISEISNDCRSIETAQAAGDDRAELALNMFASKAAKHLAAVATNLDSVEHIVFTGGIGENSPVIRSKICDRLKMMGIRLDQHANQMCPRGEISRISKQSSSAFAWVIPTNEELLIAQDTLALINRPETEQHR